MPNLLDNSDCPYDAILNDLNDSMGWEQNFACTLLDGTPRVDVSHCKYYESVS